MRRFKLSFILSVIALFVSVSISAQAQGPTPTGPNTPADAGPGPHSVGRAWFSLGRGTKNALFLVAWYPALQQDSNQSAATLTGSDEYQPLDQKTIQRIEISGYEGSSSLNPAPDSSKAPYPLVIFAEGSGSSPMSYVNLVEHLASYGFVVIASVTSYGPIWEQYSARPAVISREIDFAVNLSGRDGSFSGLIDTKHIGVVGHDLGGYAALAAAGAQFNFAWFQKWCTDYKDDPAAKIVCHEMLAHTQEMLAFAKLDAMPTALWPSWGDPRVTAIVDQSGDAYVFGPSGLASVTIPVMVQVGSQDEFNTPEWNAYLTYDNISSTQKAEIVFEGAHSRIFKDNGAPVSTQNFIHHFTTAFLLDMLKGDKEAHQALLPDAEKFPGIEYKTTMK